MLTLQCSHGEPSIAGSVLQPTSSMTVHNKTSINLVQRSYATTSDLRKKKEKKMACIK